MGTIDRAFCKPCDASLPIQDVEDESTKGTVVLGDQGIDRGQGAFDPIRNARQLSYEKGQQRVCPATVACEVVSE